MPPPIKDAFRSGDIRNAEKMLGLLSEVTNTDEDAVAGCYLILMERVDSRYGWYSGMCGYTNEGDQNSSTLWRRFMTHRSHVRAAANGTEKGTATAGMEESFYMDLATARQWKFIPTIRWNGLSKHQIEYIETAILMIGLDTLRRKKSNDSYETYLHHAGLARSDTDIGYNTNYSALNSWDETSAKETGAPRQPRTAEHRAKVLAHLQTIQEPGSEARIMASETNKCNFLLDLMGNGKTYPVYVVTRSAKVNLRAHITMNICIPKDWYAPGPPPDKVHLRLHLDESDANESDADERRPPLWPGCRVKLSATFGGGEPRFFQKKPSPRWKNAVKHWETHRTFKTEPITSVVNRAKLALDHSPWADLNHPTEHIAVRQEGVKGE
ncbi:hypothetical protein HK104_001490 [Borealophlyctis nickersoniae]|nr:hypothetical protein HK104_001490 [Borealophlyctis nickersoniae]